jgi:gamma-glutamylputrescine oxidase
MGGGTGQASAGASQGYCRWNGIAACGKRSNEPAMIVSYPDTYYAATAPAQPRAPLMGEVKADVVVIGGGFTGLSAALTLAEAGAKVVLLEADRIGYAASGRNGGQIHSGFRKDQHWLERRLGEARARALWQLAEDAKALVRGRVQKHGIDCDLREGLLIAAHSPRAARALRTEAHYLNSHYGAGTALYLGRDEANARTGSGIYHGAFADLGGGHLHPLRYALGIAQAAETAGAVLREDSRVTSLVEATSRIVAYADRGRVTADWAIVACDAFTENLLPQLGRYLAPVDSYIVATAPLSPEQRATLLPDNDAVADTRFVLDYYRLSADGRMLFSGGETFFSPADDIAALVRPRMEFVFPQLKRIPIDFAWRGTVGITRTRMPHFGRAKERVLFGYGYSGQGVALANMGGKVMGDAVLGQAAAFNLLAGMPPKAFPGGTALRRPLVAATLVAMTLRDKLP